MGAAVREITTQPFEVVFDAVCTPEAQQAGYDLVPSGGTLITLLYVNIDVTEDKDALLILGNVQWAPLDRRVFGKEVIFKYLEKLLEDGRMKVCCLPYRDACSLCGIDLLNAVLQPNRFEDLPNGLGDIVGGLERLRRDEISGMKLVCHPQEM